MIKSKAQISIFIIIAAILVILAIALFTFNSDNFKLFSDEKSSFKVTEFIEGCMEIEGKAGIDKIGKHGGWLYHPQMIFTDRSKPKYYNKRAKGLDFLEKVEMPYWYYFDEASESFELNIPEYDTENRYSLKNQLKEYVDENLERNCIESFVAFENVYDINYEPREIKTTVTFDEDDAIIELALPLEIVEKNTGNKEYIDSFKIKLENKLWIPYHIAKDITIAESKSSFIETRVLDFISPYQDSQRRDLLPPFYDFRMVYDFKPWDVKKVETLTKQIISSSIGLIQFFNTDYDSNELPLELKNNEFAQSVNNLYTKDYLSENSIVKEEEPKIFKKYQDYKVKPSFEPFFPMFFSLAPSAGDVILLPKPEAVINLIPFFFTEYVAVYEMSFPTMFIIDNNQYDNFEFNLALEANIDHNSPLKENIAFDLGLEEDISSGKSLICDPPQFISDYVTLNITDPLAGGKRFWDQNKKEFNMPETGVDGAIVTFDCKGLSSCFVAETAINGNYISKNITQLKFRLPIDCNPGTLEVYKYGYKKLTFDNLDPQYLGPINLGNAYMPSQKKMDLEIQLVGPESSQYSQGKSLGEYDTGFLIFEHLEDGDFVQVVEINEDNQYNLSINLLPGNYSIEGFVIYENNFTIPSERKCSGGGGLFSSSKCFTLDAMELESWVSGGIEFERFEISLKKLINKDKIVVNMVDFGVPSSYSTLEIASNQMADLKLTSSGKEPYFEDK